MRTDTDNIVRSLEVSFPPGFRQILGLDRRVLSPVGVGKAPDVGGWSSSGYAGVGEDLNLLYTEDRADLEWAGVTPQQIAHKLRELMRCSFNTDQEVIVDNLKVVRTAVCSKVGQECPSGCTRVSLEGRPSTGTDYEITDTVTGRTIAVSELLPHLIENHHFFEGKGTSFRLYPLEAISVLGLGIRTSEEVDRRLLSSFMDDLRDSDGFAKLHVLSRLSWFSRRSDFDTISNGILDRLLADSDYVGLRAAVSSLIIAKNKNVNARLLEIKSGLESPKAVLGDYNAFELIKKLQALERELNQDTRYPQIDGQYYPDFLGNSLLTLPDATNYCLQYVERERLTAGQIIVTARELISLYQEILPYSYRSTTYERLIQSFPELEISEQSVLKSPPRWLDQIERRIGNLFGRTGFDDCRGDVSDELVSSWSQKEIEYRKNFYSKASVVAALLIGDRQLRRYQAVLQKIKENK